MQKFLFSILFFLAVNSLASSKENQLVQFPIDKTNFAKIDKNDSKTQENSSVSLRSPQSIGKKNSKTYIQKDKREKQIWAEVLKQ